MIRGKGSFWQKGVLQQKLDVGDGHGRFLLKRLKHIRMYRLKDQDIRISLAVPFEVLYVVACEAFPSIHPEFKVIVKRVAPNPIGEPD